ncbi:MAG: SurA N-terminal domain-containing protein [Desulfarculus sp.]|nr:SurA N-terminal domain-containing protein [Pseudomonadota bacterium]MBV1714548.1 SurA N-terminal domain-containing protein [Desulfarculus sp.]MBU4576563.1 SurA N-terminal domain-containing protein [Pseudomonadota bacterium]MBU4599884.1 SurA N-terminal domain-containing protein [Pseudomonadota bacterium]MBV1740085.1 SurA N-terminal domain-containing protein [Desulfarculus sp.]
MPQRFVCCFLLAVILALPMGWVHAEEVVVNRVVAIVDDEVVTSLDLDRAIRRLKMDLARMEAMQRGGGVPPAQIKRMALERMVDEKIFAKEAKKAGLSVSDEELDHYINRIKQSNKLSDEDFVASLSRQGMTLKEYRDDLRRDILKQRLINQEVRKNVVISDAEVEQYYKAHYDQFQNMDEVNMMAIFLKVDPQAGLTAENAVRQQAENILQNIKGGGDFSKLAQQYSQGPGAERGGRLGPVKADDLLPSMRQALGELKPGQVSEVLQIPQGFVIMKLIDRSGSKELALAEVKEQIRDKLAQQKTETRFKEWMKQLRSENYVKIID